MLNWVNQAFKLNMSCSVLMTICNERHVIQLYKGRRWNNREGARKVLETRWWCRSQEGPRQPPPPGHLGTLQSLPSAPTCLDPTRTCVWEKRVQGHQSRSATRKPGNSGRLAGYARWHPPARQHTGVVRAWSLTLSDGSARAPSEILLVVSSDVEEWHVTMFLMQR